MSAIQERQTTSNEIMRGSPKYERVMRYVEGQAQRRSFISIEGPALYLWPDPARPVQNWSHPAFIGASVLAEDMLDRIPDDTTAQVDFLIDDTQNQPPFISEQDFALTFMALGTSTDFLRKYLISNDNRHQVRRIMQSSLVTNERDTCPTLDARFQKGKLRGLTKKGIIDQNDLGSNLAVIILPTDFYRQQQAEMLKYLDQELMQDRQLGISPKNSRNLINRSIKHIWVSKLGEIADVTEPVFENGKFIFKPFKY